MTTPDILQKIIHRKGEIVDARRVSQPLEQVMEAAQSAPPSPCGDRRDQEGLTE